MNYSTDKDVVSLDVATYDKLVKSAVKANLIVDRLFENSSLVGDYLSVDPEEVSKLLQLTYPQRYKNRIESLTLEECNHV